MEEAQQRRIFREYSKFLIYVCDHSNYYQHPSRVSMSHVRMMEHATHFWRARLSKVVQQKTVDYYTHVPLWCRFPSNTNVVIGVWKLFNGETVIDTDNYVEATGRRLMLQPEQKPIALASHIICKFSKSRAVVLDLCVSTSATAKIICSSHDIKL